MAFFDVTVRVEISDEGLEEVRTSEFRGDEFVEKAIRLFVTDEVFNGNPDDNGRVVVGVKKLS